MKPYNKFSIFIILFLTYTFGFGSSIDSLENVLKYQKGKFKVNTLNDLAWKYGQVNSEKAILYANQALQLSDSILFNEGKTISLNRLGNIAIINKDFEKAENLYIKVLSRERIANNTYGIGRAYNQLGAINQKAGNYEDALSNFIKAKEQFQRIGKKRIVGKILNNIGDTYRLLGDFEKGLSYLLESYKIKEELQDNYGLSYTAQNLGLLYINLKDYNQALQYLIKSEKLIVGEGYKYERSKIYKNLGVAYFKLMNVDSAAFYFQKSIEFRNYLDLLIDDADLYNNLGVIYFKQQNYDEALKTFQSALKIEESSETLRNIAHIYYLKNDYHHADEYYKKSLEFSSEFVEKINSLAQLTDISIKLNDYTRAIEYNNEYLTLRDSFESQFQNTTNLRLAYEQEKHKAFELKKNNEISVVELEKKNLENDRKQIFIYGLIVILVLVSILFFSLLQIKKQKLIASKEEKRRILESKRVNKLLQEQESKTLNAMLIGQEEERKRIAQDLHDRLGGTLAMVKNHFKTVEEKIADLQDANLKVYTTANKLLDDACADVRKIAHNMYNSTLSNFGLIASVEDLSQKLEENEGLSIEFIHHGFESRLPIKLEVPIYNILHELIGNTLKHAEASELTIQLVKGEDYVNITVEDDGKGFNTEKYKQGLGLKNIFSRVEALDGECKIDSKPGHGTSVMIDISLNKNSTL